MDMGNLFVTLGAILEVRVGPWRRCDEARDRCDEGRRIADELECVPKSGNRFSDQTRVKTKP